jgi:sirohydrochlorin ferrochelatase
MAAVAEQTGLTTLPAYLDLAEPDLGGAVRQLVDAGYTGAVVVPLLFTEAFHATVDVPETVRSVTESLAVQLIVADILGTGDEVAQLLRERMASSGIDDRASVLLFAVGSSRPAANEAVVDLASRLAAVRSRPALAAFGTMDPRPDAVLAQLPEPIAVVPLFLCPGMLDPMAELAARRGWPMATRSAPPQPRWWSIASGRHWTVPAGVGVRPWPSRSPCRPELPTDTSVRGHGGQDRRVRRSDRRLESAYR